MEELQQFVVLVALIFWVFVAGFYVGYNHRKNKETPR
jgi:uncharacterized membrane protein